MDCFWSSYRFELKQKAEMKGVECKKQVRREKSIFLWRFSNQRSKRCTILSKIHPFIHTFKHPRQSQPHRATGSDTQLGGAGDRTSNLPANPLYLLSHTPKSSQHLHLHHLCTFRGPPWGSAGGRGRTRCSPFLCSPRHRCTAPHCYTSAEGEGRTQDGGLSSL